jgi:FkbH-like protein
MNLLNTITKNRKLKLLVKGKKYKIAIISNITVHIFKDFIEFALREKGINAEVNIANYNNLVQESVKYKNYDAVIIFYELINLFENFQYKILNLDKKKIKKYELAFKEDLRLSFKILKNTPVVLINEFSTVAFECDYLKKSKLSVFTKNLNNFLQKNVKTNFSLVNIDLIISNLGIDNCIDRSNFFTTKALYKTKFMHTYAEKIKPVLLSANGIQKKAIILDCDNTLWGGILGEDHQNKIEFNEDTEKGRIFKQAQIILKGLKSQGVILNICSKNNFNDIANFFKKSSGLVLKFDDFVIKKINWKNKVDNIRDIAKELNIGIDTMIFVDDSSYEIGLVKKYLKEVKCVQVPKDLSEYTKVLEGIKNDFCIRANTKEDSTRTKMYLQEKERLEHMKKFSQLDNYVKSLKIKIKFSFGKGINTARAAQMCQKTNQFNLTTIRYSETDIKKMISNKKIVIITISVKDIYGDYGITGLMITKINKNSEASIDIFLISCRIIGRKVEESFLRNTFKVLKKMRIKILKAKYIRTEKNNLVQDLYEKNGFKLTSNKRKIKLYQKSLS